MLFVNGHKQQNALNLSSGEWQGFQQGSVLLLMSPNPSAIRFFIRSGSFVVLYENEFKSLRNVIGVQLNYGCSLEVFSMQGAQTVCGSR